MRLGQDIDLFRELVGYLDREGSKWKTEIASYLAAGDLQKVQLRAHSLKGLISNFGPGRAWRSAAKVEELARTQRAEEIPAQLGELDEAYDELMAALSPHLNRAKSTN